MITNKEYANAFDLDEMTEEEIIKHRETYFGTNDPLVGPSYLFDWCHDEESESEFLVVCPKHYFETTGYHVDQDGMCPLLPSDDDHSDVVFFEEMPCNYIVDGVKDYSKKDIENFLFSLGMIRGDLSIEGSYPLTTEMLKNKIDVWMSNLSSHTDLQQLSWKRISKKKQKNFVVPDSSRILVHRDQVSGAMNDTTVREFVNTGKTQTHKLTVVSVDEDKSIGYWWVEKL